MVHHARLHLIVDTRDKRPFTFDGRHKITKKALPCGDYSLWGYSRFIAVERKNLSDFLINCGVKQTAFRSQLTRLSRLRYACVVVEGSISDFCRFTRINQFARTMIVARLTAQHGVPIIFAGDRHKAEMYTEHFLRQAKHELDNLSEETVA